MWRTHATAEQNRRRTLVWANSLLTYRPTRPRLPPPPLHHTRPGFCLPRIIFLFCLRVCIIPGVFLSQISGACSSRGTDCEASAILYVFLYSFSRKKLATCTRRTFFREYLFTSVSKSTVYSHKKLSRIAQVAVKLQYADALDI